MELEEKQTNGLIRSYLIEVNLSQLMGLRQKLKLSIWLSLTVLPQDPCFRIVICIMQLNVVNFTILLTILGYS